MNRSLRLAGIVAAALAFAVSPAVAGKPGGGGGGSGGSTATVSASPNPASVGAQVNLSGCGYALVPAQVQIVEPSGSTLTSPVGVWSSGCLDTVYFVPTASGTYSINVYQLSGSRRGSTLVLKASTTLTVI